MDEPKSQGNPTETTVEYVEVKLQQVLNFFAQAYKPQEGTVTDHEAFVDTAQGKVVFKLIITT